MYTRVCSVVWHSQKVYRSRRCREKKMIPQPFCYTLESFFRTVDVRQLNFNVANAGSQTGKLVLLDITLEIQQTDHRTFGCQSFVIC
jgi:hypothetical protein